MRSVTPDVAKVGLDLTLHVSIPLYAHVFQATALSYDDDGYRPFAIMIKRTIEQFMRNSDATSVHPIV
jgi:hypothetical protein